MSDNESNISLALVHYPTLNKQREIVTTSVTTIDLHDISRLSKTYGISKFYVVTAVKAQQQLVNRLAFHWLEGFGSKYNISRKVALESIMVVDSLEKIYQNARSDLSIFATTAKKVDRSISFKTAKEIIKKSKNNLIIFGTGYGLADHLIDEIDYILDPVEGFKGYNHLSVRTAVAIVLDRLLGEYV